MRNLLENYGEVWYLVDRPRLGGMHGVGFADTIAVVFALFSRCK
jgi:hypothetical protein